MKRLKSCFSFSSKGKRSCKWYALTLAGIMAIGNANSVFAESNQKRELGGYENQQPQTITVTGSVTDEQGEPMPGVSIVIKGTNTGTISDLDGKFSLPGVTASTKLVFSFIGMSDQEVIVGDQTSINVILVEESTGLNEVVVTAMGIKKEKKRLGYAMTEVKGKEIIEMASVNPISALEGKIAGVEIDNTSGGSFGGSRITIRGNATLSGNGQPIFVVDGLIVENAYSGGSQWGSIDWGNELKNLNSDNFESVSVLKGAAATALYGSRAINGVVLITTKKGIKRQGLGVDVNHQTTWEKPYGGYDFQNEFGAGWDYMTEDADEYLGMAKNSDGTYTPIPYVYSFGPRMVGQEIKWPDGTMGKYSPQPDNLLDAYETGQYNNTNVAISGGTENSTFRLSYSNTEKKGVAIRNDFSKNSISLRATRNVGKYINIDAGVALDMSEGKNPPRGGSYNSHNIGRKYYYQFPRNYDTKYFQQNYKDPETNARLDPAKYRGSDLWFNLYEQTYLRNEKSIKGNMKVTANITDFLNFRVEGYYNMFDYMMEEKNFSNTGTGSNGYYGLEQSSKEEYTLKLFANFSKQIGEFELNASAIGEMWETNRYWTKANTRGGFVEPGIFNVSNSKETPIQGRGGLTGEKMINSLYGFVDLGWRNQLFLNISGRNDWSSALTYPDGSGNNSYFYPSVSSSWIFSETFELPGWLDYGQLRVSYAEVGNDTSPYTLTSGFVKDNGIDFVDVNGDKPLFYTYESKTIPNPDLEPERQRSYEIGTNLVFFQNRINLDFNYYKNNNINQILNIGVTSEAGVSNQKVNSGNLENKGIEIQLGLVPVRTPDVKWDMTFTYANNKDKLVELIEGMEYFPINTGNGLDVSSRAYEDGGYGDLYTRYAYTRYQHLDASGNELAHPNNGKYVLNTDGFYKRAGVDTKVGTAMANWRGGLINEVSYKNFSLKIGLSAKMGGDLISSAHQYGTMAGLLKSTLPGRDAAHGGIVWTADDDVTYQDGIIPDGVFDYGVSIGDRDVSGMTFKEAYDEGLVEPMHAIDYYDGIGSWGSGIREMSVLENSYVAIKNVRLAYNIPQRMVDRLHLQRMTVALFGTDLGFLYTSLPDGLSPYSILNNKPGNVVEYSGAPLTRTLGFSINIGL